MGPTALVSGAVAGAAGGSVVPLVGTAGGAAIGAGAAAIKRSSVIAKVYANAVK